MAEQENVVLRLKRRLQETRALGIRVRIEPLDGEQPGWCQIGGVTTLFVDLSQTASEQLVQLEESLYSLLADQTGGVDPRGGRPNSGKRAA